MIRDRSVAIRTWALGCASAIALLTLSACEQPRAPEPLPPPPPPEQAMDDMGPPDRGAPPVEEDEGPKPPDEMAPDADDRGPPPDMEAPPEPEPPVAMAPIPNPPDADEYGRPYRGRHGRGGHGRGPVETRERPPIADAADEPPPPPIEMAPGTMAPIPNPPEPRRARPGDAELMGAPSRPTRMAQAAPPMRAAPPPIVVGPVARAPIAPAPAPAAPSTARPRTPTAPSASGSASTSASAPAVADAAGGATPPVAAPSLDAAADTLRGRIESDARLEVPQTWTPGQTQEVRLRFPQGFATEVANATAGLTGPGGGTELSATLAGDGYRIEPTGAQSIASDGADNGLVWRVTPDRADPAPLRATVEASVPVAGGRRTLALGEVGNGATRGFQMTPPTIGWILLALLAGAIILWIASRRPRNPDEVESDRRRRARSRDAARPRTEPFDFRPDDESAEARSARVDQLRADEAAARARDEADRDRP